MSNSTKSTSSNRKPVRSGASGDRAASDSPKRTNATQPASSKLAPGGVNDLPRWTFLTNHAHVLATLYANPDCVLRQVAWEVGITERAVQRIIQELEEDGFIERERVGRRNRYKVLTDQPLRHPVESHRNIGDLMKLVCGTAPE